MIAMIPYCKTVILLWILFEGDGKIPQAAIKDPGFFTNKQTNKVLPIFTFMHIIIIFSWFQNKEQNSGEKEIVQCTAVLYQLHSYTNSFHDVHCSIVTIWTTL